MRIRSTYTVCTRHTYTHLRPVRILPSSRASFNLACPDRLNPYDACGVRNRVLRASPPTSSLSRMRSLATRLTRAAREGALSSALLGPTRAHGVQLTTNSH